MSESSVKRSKSAVQFGAGNIGRGFMGQLFYEAGYHTTFIDAVPELVCRLVEAGRYSLRVLDAEQRRERNLVIDAISAILVSDRGRTDAAIVAADVIATAVGVKYLEDIAPVLASGLSLRRAHNPAPVDIYLCENLLDAAGRLKSAVFALLPAAHHEWAEQNVGFVGTSVARMVPVLPEALRREDPLLVVADGYHKLPYDGPASRAPRPPIEGMEPVANFAAEGERKLFVYNMAHASLAYLGHRRGFTWVHQTFSDPASMDLFDAALEEACTGLGATHPDAFSAQYLAETAADIRLRFANPMLMDTIDRVGRDPIRKLGVNDRFIGCALMCTKAGIVPSGIASICAATLRYDRASDPDAIRLQQMIKDQGASGALCEITGLAPDHDLIGMVIRCYEEG